MSIIVYSKHLYDCEANNIEVYFEYNNSVVFSMDKETTAISDSNIDKCKKLVVITKCELEEYSSYSDAIRYSRGDNLVLQGIITFFTGIPLTVYHSRESSYSTTPLDYEKQDFYLKINGVDYSSDLIIMLNRLNQEPKLIITLLDRWRKAIYLKEESYDADLYYDEATLNIFHVFELFGECFADELKNRLENNIESMLFNHFKYYYYTDATTTQMIEQNKKAVNSLLIGDSLNLSIKLKYFLEKYELLDDNVAFFIDNMIRVRNTVAHGRITYQNLYLWPLSPFFNLSKDAYENIEFLFFLSAQMISKYIGINRWEKEWDEKKEFLMPPKQIISDFLENNLGIDSFNRDMLIWGNKYNITWRTLFNYYVKTPKKKIKERIEVVTKDLFANTLVTEENSPDIFNISIVFADSDDSDIKQKAIRNVKAIISNDWYGWLDFKDAYRYLDYYSVPVVWYKEFLLNEEYIELKKH